MTTTLSYGSNPASQSAQTGLSQAVRKLSEAAKRLSSGMRINGPEDDAAGLALSTQINNEAGLYSRAVQNINDGISLVNLAQDAVEALSNILTRLEELATEATNTALSNTQRTALDEEAQALAAEYDRIVADTEFNNINLLDGTFGTKSLQADPYPNSKVNITIGAQLDDLEGSATLGDGTFKIQTTAYVNVAGYDVDLGDVNGDGALDIVNVGNSNTINVLYGNGNGTFQAGITLTTTGIGNYYDVELVDINADSKLDLVALSSISGVANVFLGNGNGTFQSWISNSTPALARGLDFADFNGDSKMDIVVASSNVSGFTTVQLGNGNGTFDAPFTVHSASSGEGVIAYDINGDSKVDIITSNSSAVYVALGNGNNTYSAPTSFSGGGFYELDLGDVNGDGDVDLVVGTGGVQTFVNVFLGNGNGTFAARSTVSVGTGTFDVEFYDANGDGLLDLFSTSQNGGNNYFSVALGNGNGTFAARVSFVNTSASFTPQFSIGDLNTDGVADVVTNIGGATRVGIFLANSSAQITEIDLSNYTVAARSLTIIETAITALRGEQASVAASAGRLASTVNYLTQMRDNLDASYHRIVDADMADEVSKMVRGKIMQQGAIAVLAQANMQPERALALLNESV